MIPPSTSGTYILLVELPVATSTEIGKLGRISFEAGTYAYLGSAFGPGGLAARLRRHTFGPRKTHWHIDYLLEHAVVRTAMVSSSRQRLECAWAEWLRDRGLNRVPGFGSSDCRCSSHLFFVGNEEEAEEIIHAAGCELKATLSFGGR